MNKRTKSKKHKHILFAMIFAFIWVIFGDLVSIHLDLIFDQERANWNQPFTKTQKTSQKTYKVNSNKTVDNSNPIQFAFIGTNSIEFVCYFQEVQNYILSTKLVHIEHELVQYLRGPPSYC